MADISEGSTSSESRAPWEELAELIQRGKGARRFLSTLPGSETVLAISRLPEHMQTQLFTQLRPDDAADLMEQLPDVAAVEIVEHLQPDAAARIIHELPSDEQADLIGELDAEDAEAILAQLEPQEAGDVRTLAAYEDDEAGGLMVTEFLAYRESATVGDLIEDLRNNRDIYADYDVQYAYVIDKARRLIGVMRIRDLLLSKPGVAIRELMIRDPFFVEDHTPIDEVASFFEEHDIVGVPVVDAERRLLGVVHGAALEAAMTERSDNDYRSAQGIVGGEELRTMPLMLRSRRRLSWLSLNIVLNIVAASVISAFESTLQAVIALAVFLPIISDMSGCSGNQAVAVSIRELSLGYVRPAEVLRVWTKEICVGALNGAVLGALIAVVAWLWKGNAILGLVVGVAMLVNTMVAVSIGGLVPLVLKRFGKDPALASGPILTTVTDMCGFFLVLGLAASLIEHLR
ncbi:MAG: magnesium transporter [Planctomycetes bacterium]|nr:magnesium transporter [Planctomycetota bacterium]